MDGFIKVAAAVLTLTMLSACAVIPFQKEAEVKEQEDDEVYEVKMRDDYTDLAKKMFYDLTFMCKQLEGRQYGLYDCISKKEFYALQQAVADKLNDLSEVDYYFELRRIIASIGVAHTTLNLNYTGTFPFQMLPYSLRYYHDGWILNGIDGEYADYLGAEIVALNGVEMADVKAKAKELISYENESWLNEQIPSLLVNADALVNMGILEDNKALTLTVKKDDEVSEITLHSETGPLLVGRLETVQLPKAATYRQPKFYTGFMLADQTYYVQYNSCEEISNYSMSQFASDVEKTMNEQHCKKLILDLRYNTGGNSLVIEPLLMMINRYRQDNDLKLITLIAEQTYSSGIMNAVQLKYNYDSVLIGTPTGGNVNGYGETDQFYLNYFPYFVIYCQEYFEMVPGYELDSLYPDIDVEVNYKDLMQGIDRCVEIALQE